MGETTTELLPSGILVTSGGTRTSVKLNRPWQTDVGDIVNPENCPFERIPQDELSCDEKGWRVIRNKFTPYALHRVIIPTECWHAEKMYGLGGVDAVKAVFRIADQIVDQENIASRVLYLGIHVGVLAGQNLGHLHWHLLDTEADSITPSDKFFLSDDRLVFAENGYAVYAGGIRGGQCIIVPVNEPQRPTPAEIILRLIETAKVAFCSTQGRAPHYMVWLQFRNKQFIYGSYLPILNQIGLTEYIAFIEGGNSKAAIPWPHETTAMHLRGED